MKPQNKILNALGLVLFFTGILLGVAFFGSLTWANLEARFYFGFNGGAETTLRLTCPHIMTTHDTGSVTAVVANKVEKTINPIFQADISGPLLRSVRTQPSIEPGKTQQVKWEISAKDVDYGHLIMAQVYQYASFKTPTATATCGTLFLNLPGLTGMQVYILILVVSLLGIAIGIALWLIGNRTLKGRFVERLWEMVLLTVVVLVGILFGSLGLWIFGTLALVLSLLMFVVLIGRRFMPS
jgi:hypothetical protein